MSYESEAVGQMFSLTVNGTMYAIQLGVNVSKEILAFLKKLTETKTLSQHRLTMEEFLKKGGGVQAFNITEQDYKLFQKAVKHSPVQYFLGKLDQTSQKGERLYTIYVSAHDVPSVNQIIELNHLNVVDRGGAAVTQQGDEVGQTIPPFDPQKYEENQAGHSWEEFFDQDGNFVDEQEERERAAANPTPPESEQESAQASQSSSGQQKESHEPQSPHRENQTEQSPTAPQEQKTTHSSTESRRAKVYDDFDAIEQMRAAQQSDHAQPTARWAADTKENAFSGASPKQPVKVASQRRPMAERLAEAREIQKARAVQALEQETQHEVSKAVMQR